MRRAHDFYETAPWQTRALLAHQRIDGVIIEPCVGDGSIEREIAADCWRRTEGKTCLVTNDLNPDCTAEFHFNAASDDLYLAVAKRYGWVDWVVTNPPYGMPLCRDIVSLAVRHARKGVAMMLRISFREPTAKINPRGPFLQAHPPQRLLTLPRYSFTGDGSSDSATTEWVIWIKDRAYNVGDPILSLYNADQKYAAPLFSSEQSA